MARFNWIRLAIGIAVLAPAMTTACSKSEATTSSPPPETRSVELPAGWARHSTEDFEIAVPDEWITLEVTPQAIDAMIEELGDTDPSMVASLKALKNQDAVKFWSMVLSPSGFGTNVSVGKSVRLFSLDSYESAMKKQLAPMGITLLNSKKGQLDGDPTMTLSMEGSVGSPDGTRIAFLEEQLAVDHGGYNYFVTLTFAKDEAGEYLGLFDQLVASFFIR